MLPKPQRLTATLPPTPCTQETRNRMVKLAQENNVSLAHAQRAAFALFLSLFNTKPDTPDTHPISSEHQLSGTNACPSTVPAPRPGE
jgi:hypothetical protein